MVDLDKDVKYVKTVGPNRVKLLNKLNIYTLKDLIEYYIISTKPRLNMTNRNMKIEASQRTYMNAQMEKKY